MHESTAERPAAGQCEGVTGRPNDVTVDLLFVPVFQDEDRLDDLPGLDEATGGEIGRARGRGEFKGRAYELFLTPVNGAGWQAKRVALVGAGRRADADAERLRRIAAAAAYTAQLRAVETMGIVIRRGLDVAA